MQTDPIDDLQATIETLWARSGLENCVRIARERLDDGSPHVEVRNGFYDIVTTERGSETRRVAGLSRSDAARWFVFDMARGHSLSAELKSRRRPEDAPTLATGLKKDGYSRWNWMEPTIAIMRRISPDLGDWAAREYEQVLGRHPLTDSEKRNARYAFPSTTKDG